MPIRCALLVKYEKVVLLDFPESESEPFTTTRMNPISFTWTMPNGRQERLEIAYRGGAFSMPGFDESYKMVFVNLATLQNPQIWAGHFSKLSKRNLIDGILTKVRRIFPQIEGLSLELLSDETVIFASMQGLSEKIPLNLISAGASKFVYLLLAIGVCPKGVLLVDEIDNGIYYETLPEMWRVLIEACQENDTQVIATTHSRECIAGLAGAVNDPDDVRLLRTEREGITSSITSVVEVEGESLLAAVDEGLDLR